MLVAGMKANTTYGMRARANLSNGITLVDFDHTFTTGALPQASFPAITVSPPGLARSGGVELISSQATTVSALVLTPTARSSGTTMTRVSQLVILHFPFVNSTTEIS